MDQSKLRVSGQSNSQRFLVGKYKKVSVRAKRLSESAAGLSELEKLGGLLPIQPAEPRELCEGGPPHTRLRQHTANHS